MARIISTDLGAVETPVLGAMGFISEKASNNNTVEPVSMTKSSIDYATMISSMTFSG